MIDSNKRYKIFARDFFTCQKCNKSIQDRLTLAHRIKSGNGSEEYIIKYAHHKHNITITKKQASDILDDESNLITACRGNCNDSFNIFFNDSERDNLLENLLKKHGLTQ